jgi:predicted protein tyrosine phosphatase
MPSHQRLKKNIMKRILFVCGQNKLRSPTAESVFSSNPVRSVGLKNNSDVQVGIDDVEWAEYIFVMEKSHKRKLQKLFLDCMRCDVFVS